MRAVTHVGSEAIEIREHPDPVAADGQILVRVFAAGLNRADLHQRAGKYPAPPGWPADIPGLEYAGEVVAIGSGTIRWRVGDRVMGLVGGGAQAELLVVAEGEAMAIPDAMEYSQAAAIPEAFLTAWDALHFRGRAVPGERVLMHAIGSGVGTAAAQLGRHAGLQVIGTSRTADKLERATLLGMSRGVLTSGTDWPAEVGEVDVIIDTLGAQALSMNLSLLALRGRLVVLGTLTGGQAPGIDLSLVLRKRLEIVGTAMRSRPSDERRELVARFSNEVLPLFTNGTLRPVIERVLPMVEVESAHQLLQSNETFGKIILEW